MGIQVQFSEDIKTKRNEAQLDKLAQSIVTSLSSLSQSLEQAATSPRGLSASLEKMRSVKGPTGEMRSDPERIKASKEAYQQAGVLKEEAQYARAQVGKALRKGPEAFGGGPGAETFESLAARKAQLDKEMSNLRSIMSESQKLEKTLLKNEQERQERASRRPDEQLAIDAAELKEKESKKRERQRSKAMDDAQERARQQLLQQASGKDEKTGKKTSSKVQRAARDALKAKFGMDDDWIEAELDKIKDGEKDKKKKTTKRLRTLLQSSLGEVSNFTDQVLQLPNLARGFSAGGSTFQRFRSAGFSKGTSIAAGISSGIGTSLMGFLSKSLQTAEQVTNAALNAANVLGKNAKAIYGSDRRFGFTPMEKSQFAQRYAIAAGGIGSPVKGMGRTPEGLLTSMAAERLGVGGSFVGLVGALSQTGADMTQKNSAITLLRDGVAAGLESGLKRGRLREVFAGLAKFAATAAPGTRMRQQDLTALAAYMGMVGKRAGEGTLYSGAKGLQAARTVDQLSRGRGGEGALGFALMSAGFGRQGVGLTSAIRRMEAGASVSKQRGFLQTIGRMAGPLGPLLLWQMTGQGQGGTLKMFEDMMNASADPSMTGDSVAKMVTRRSKKSDAMKMARTPMQQFGRFKQKQLGWVDSMTNIGMDLSDSVTQIHSTLHELSKMLRPMVKDMAQSIKALNGFLRKLTPTMLAVQKALKTPFLKGFKYGPAGGIANFMYQGGKSLVQSIFGGGSKGKTPKKASPKPTTSRQKARRSNP